MFSYFKSIFDTYMQKRTAENEHKKYIVDVCDKIIYQYIHRGMKDITFSYIFTDEELRYNTSENKFIHTIADKIGGTFPEVDVIYVNGQKILLLLPKDSN